jgi:predicted TIM-barrel fold metal-dependent hydrolase
MNLPDPALRKIFGENALRLFRLGEPPERP